MTGEPTERSYLLDTHVAIFSMSQSTSLSSEAKRAIAKGRNVLSVVVYWEVMLKSMKGLLDVGDPRDWWREALEQLAATPLTFKPGHIAGLYALPVIHRDPFDRILIAQSIVEGLTLVTADAELARYSQSGLQLVI